MTGFGKYIAQLPDKTVSIEIKSLNSKQIDIHLRLPNEYKEKEPEIRQMAGNILERGKIELTISLENTGDTSSYTINRQLAMKYYEELKGLAEIVHYGNPSELLSTVMRFPEVLQSRKEDLDEEDWGKIREGVMEVLKQVNTFRTDEGAMIEKDFRKRIEMIRNLEVKLDPLEKERTRQIKDRLEQKLAEIKEKTQVDSNRFEQELIYYLEKIDITEERVRLRQHCEYFLETLDQGGSIGRKLSFITQEMGREINTIGSKANNAEIQRIVVLMKDELEKIKEQLFNIL